MANQLNNTTNTIHTSNSHGIHIIKKKTTASSPSSANSNNPSRYLVVACFLTAAVYLLGREPKLPETRVAKATVQPIRQISILGERNSGTRWTYEYVRVRVCVCGLGIGWQQRVPIT
jgi:hypothetical protein